MRRRIFTVVGVMALMAAMVAISAVPAFAAECSVAAGSAYPTIQSAVDDTNCETILVSSDLENVSVTIDRDVTIIGEGARQVRLWGTGGDRVFTISAGSTVTLENLQISNGRAHFGGGINNAGSLTLVNSLVVGNYTFPDAGVSALPSGGGIYNMGTLTLNDSEVNGNYADVGGGIYNEGTVTLNDRSRVTHNEARRWAGGILNAGTLYLCGFGYRYQVENNEAGDYRNTRESNIEGNSPRSCGFTSPPPQVGTPPQGGNGSGEKGERVLIEHKGKELCLPRAALKGHLRHGDEIISEEGCSNATAAKKGRGGGRGK